MAAETASVGHGDVPCPDPSVHEKHSKLSEQASTAALYVTHPERRPDSRESQSRENPLGPDGKLSSKGLFVVSATCIEITSLKQRIQAPLRP